MAKGKYQYWLTDEGLNKLRGWARKGLKDKTIADNIGIKPQTLYDWKRRFSSFSEALKKTKEIIDNEAEEALIRAMLGYDYEEVTTYIDSNGKKSVKKVKKHMPPNITALIFYLKNRRPEDWRDILKKVITGVNDGPIEANINQKETKVQIYLPDNGREDDDT